LTFQEVVGRLELDRVMSFGYWQAFTFDFRSWPIAKIQTDPPPEGPLCQTQRVFLLLNML
jgi:hypothetical protein